MRAERGIVLVDVLVASAVLAIVLLVLLTVLNQDLERLAQADDRQTATGLADRLATELELTLATGEPAAPPPSLERTAWDQAGGRERAFTWTNRVRVTEEPNLSEIAVRVGWRGRRGDEAVEVSRYVLIPSRPVR